MGLAEVERAAVSRFAADGFAGTGIREVGRAVGLNSASLYHYVSTKQDLLTGVMRQCLDELDRGAVEAVAGVDEPVRQLVRLVAAHVGMSAQNPATCRVTDQELRSLTGENLQAVVDLRDRYEARWDAVLRRGVRTAGFEVNDRSISRLALLDMCNGVANWYLPGGRLSVARLQLRFAELACRMVGVTASSLRDDAAVDIVRLACEPRGASDVAEATA